MTHALTPIVLEKLEDRTFLSVATPGGSGAYEPSAVVYQPMASPTLSVSDRQELLNNWQGSNAATLQGYLTAGNTTAFDNELLNYMRTRTNRAYFFHPDDATGILSFIDSDAGLRNQRTSKIAKANDILAHKFPLLVGSSSYTVQLPAGGVDFINQPAATSNTEFRYTLNRHFYWNDLAMAYRFSGTSTYITELRNQLDSWCRQYTRLASPDDWIKDTVRPKWDLFTTSERVKNWLYTYNMVLKTSGWDGYTNTMFLHRLWLQGDFMARTTKIYELTSNKATGHYTAMYELGMLFPEFKNSTTLYNTGLSKMHQCLDTQFRADGLHYEQSPSYHGGAMSGFFDAFHLAQKNNLPWSDKATRRLRNIIEGFYQLLAPTGTQSALSDTYRSVGSTFFSQAAILLDSDRWPKSRPRLDDIWQIGTADCTPLLSAPTTPTSLPDRFGTAYYPDSGYYVSRTGDDSDARQLILDAGPKGGDHGHYDLLNFELFGYGKPLINDPGLLSYDAADATARAEIISTPAHNTISIDGLSHAASEKSTVSKLTLWLRKTGSVQMAATHYAYQNFKGAPIVARNVWHDRGDLFIVVDWASAGATHTYSQTFNLFTNATTGFVGGRIRTTTGSGDVMLVPILGSGQTTSSKSVTLSNTAPPSGNATGLRFNISQSGRSAVFATVMATFDNGVVPNISAQWLRMPTASKSGQIEVTKNGVTTIVYFPMPDLTNVASAAAVVRPAATPAANAPAPMTPAAVTFSKSLIADDGGDVWES